ncbi:F-box protein DOR-like [Raphanus sativus]|uniref:F-box protein DOR-like n=1 Tax=Raphanus sativus TaxID=3726 RepID=A0A9W3BW24_RAPSA|nr:F-box protein DOR-like [Raphanus sativus]
MTSVSAMKLPRHNFSDDVRSISPCRSGSSSTSMNGRENSEPIPHDLIYEILLRLPAISIARFRCVSKLWASTLRSHAFTELFLTRSSTRQQFLFACQNDDEMFFFTAPQNPDKNSSLVDPYYHMKIPCIDDTSKICGHVRGLVCLTHLRTVKGRKHTVPEICNPSTGQSIFLPKVKTNKVNVRSFFVYDPIGKQFKVLSMTWPCYGNDWLCKEYQVLTLGTKKQSWRMIQCSVPHHPISGGICINGCLYYHSKVASIEQYTIVCFDVTSEKFTSIRKATGNVLWIELNLVNYNGKLATLTSDGHWQVSGESRCIELWVLVDAEKHEWSKHVYQLPTLWKDVVANDFLFFIGISGTDEILILAHSLSGINSVLYYDFVRGTIRKVEIEGIDAFRHCNTFIHHVENVKLFANV